MSDEMETVRDTPVFSYVIASGEMRYIEVNERNIYLRDDPLVGPVLRGEIPGCGPGCYADLSQMFLEFVTSNEGCKDQNEAEAATIHFGQQIGKTIAAKLSQHVPGVPTIGQLSHAFECLLNSMNVPYTVERTTANLRYTLAYCPLRESAINTGFNCGVPTAYLGFSALCESMLRDLAPDWKLLQPSAQNFEDPLLEIAVARL